MKNFMKLNIENIEKYVHPCLITMTGKSGAGKTLLAQQLSRELKIFLLSNDYIRTYFLNRSQLERKEIEKEVLRINSERLIKLMISHTPFVIDRDFNTKNELVLINRVAHLCGYMPIHIKINSCDEENIRRIQNRKVSYQKRDFTIIGDNTAYSTPFTEEDYFQIKKRKPRLVKDFPFDYELNNTETEEKFIEQSIKVIEDMKEKRLIKQKSK